MRTPSTSGKGLSRRTVLRNAALYAAGMAISSLGIIPLGLGNPLLLRPPGAVPEKDFLSSCIKCGQCLQVCPVDAIRLARVERGFAIGTPHIDARQQACDFSCDALQCILACPTGALDHRLTKPAEVHMGIAELTHPESCLAVRNQGFTGHPRGADYPGLLRYQEIDRWKPQPVKEHPYTREVCDLCVIQCPIPEAIRLESRTSADGKPFRIPVVQSTCTGCGVCEMICPTEQASIQVIPWKVWRPAREESHG